MARGSRGERDATTEHDGRRDERPTASRSRPAVTRAARHPRRAGRGRRRRRSGRASSPAGSASRSRRSPTSAARSPTPASSAGSAPGSPSAAGWPSSAAPTSPPSTRSRSSTRRAARLADRLRGDRPARGPRRARDDLPRPPRRPPAGPPDLADRAAAAGDVDRDGQGRPGLARSSASSTAGLPGVTRLPALTRQLAPHGRRAARRSRSGPRPRLRDRRRGDRWRASSATAS